MGATTDANYSSAETIIRFLKDYRPIDCSTCSITIGFEHKVSGSIVCVGVGDQCECLIQVLAAQQQPSLLNPPLATTYQPSPMSPFRGTAESINDAFKKTQLRSSTAMKLMSDPSEDSLGGEPRYANWLRICGPAKSLEDAVDAVKKASVSKSTLDPLKPKSESSKGVKQIRIEFEDIARASLSSSSIEKSPEKVVQKLPEKAMPKPSAKVMEDSPAKAVQKFPENVIQKSPEKVVQKSSEKAMQKSPENVMQESSEKVEQKSPEKVEQKSPEIVMHKSSEKVAEKSSEKAMLKSPENVMQLLPEKLTQKLPEKVAQKSPENVMHKSAEKVAQKSPEKVAEKLPENVMHKSPEKVAQKSPEKVAEKLPEKVMEKPSKPVEAKPIQGDNKTWMNMRYSQNLKTGSVVNITFTWSPVEFHVVAMDDMEKLEEFQQGLITLVADNKLAKLTRKPKKDDVVIAEYEDGFYRARVTVAGPNSAQLEFIDFGDKISVESKDLLEMTDEMFETPVFGLRVNLGGINAEDINRETKLDEQLEARLYETTYGLKLFHELDMGVKSNMCYLLDADAGVTLNEMLMKVLCPE